MTTKLTPQERVIKILGKKGSTEFTALLKQFPAAQKMDAEGLKAVLDELDKNQRVRVHREKGRCFYALPEQPRPCLALGPAPRPFRPLSAKTLACIATAGMRGPRQA